MRDFKIYGELGENPKTTSFMNFMKEVEDGVNSNAEIIEQAQKCNLAFANDVKAILRDEDNLRFAGTMISAAKRKVPRYTVIKNLAFDSKDYEAEIDLLERKFVLIEI